MFLTPNGLHLQAIVSHSFRFRNIFAWCLSIRRRTYILWLDLRAIARLLPFCSISLWWLSNATGHQRVEGMTWDSRLRLDVVDDEIIITMPGTSYSVTYFKRANSPQLLARDPLLNCTRKI